MTTRPFTVGIIQDSASPDMAATLEASVAHVREAAARGAQIICLKELFNAPYFAKSQKFERFDIAEPIPGPTTDVMQKLAKELEVVIIVPIFEKQARGVYRNSAAIVDADGTLLGVYRKMHIPDDPLFNEKYYFVPGDAVARRSHRQDRRGRQAGERLPRLAHALREHRRADLLGPVVSRGGAHHEPPRRRHPLLSRRPSAGTPPRSRSSARRSRTRGARSSARTPSRTASSSRRRIASATRRSPAPTASSSSATPSSPTRSAASSPRRVRAPRSSRPCATRS